MHNEPLLFIQTPPVYVRITFTEEPAPLEEESTSIFAPHSQEIEKKSVQLEVARSDEEQETVSEEKAINPSVIRRIMYLASSFPRQIYKPLQFVLSDETVTGTIARIEGESVFIELEDEGQTIAAVDLVEIEEILWRGTPFQER
ncbi:hypothetical protein OXB_1825 [Bacillus sp. OxB-1]|uniref:hypothetical protein n=1 Tax=Bacillus sp. (strain OxB-1) TaxID=98228 RepID=UPI000581E1AC|nr:hypothetical protein [Bacillus sp. OxB-1]BAQ10296.1 hypothetical protein OXB_1825 [Bacillus sp. OxB-1]